MKPANPKKLTLGLLLPLFFLTIGLLLLVGKIYADNEPGAIPLLLILGSGGWMFFNRVYKERPAD